MSVTMRCFNSRKEWLEARTSCVGGSDAAAIIGLHPYKSNVDLWEEKVGLRKPEDISDKPYVRYGNDAEPLLRKLFELDHPEMVVSYEEHNMWHNDRFPFAHASLDGWMWERETGKDGILEIKTSEILNTGQWDKWRDKVPDNYYAQCLWYLAVTEYDFVVLKAQLKTVKDGNVRLDTRHYRIERTDVEQDIEYLMEKAADFAECIKEKRRPALVLPEI